MKFNFKKFFNLFSIGLSASLLTMLLSVIIVNLFYKPFELELGILELSMIISPTTLFAFLVSISFDKDDTRDDILDDLN